MNPAISPSFVQFVRYERTTDNFSESHIANKEIVSTRHPTFFLPRGCCVFTVITRNSRLRRIHQTRNVLSLSRLGRMKFLQRNLRPLIPTRNISPVRRAFRNFFETKDQAARGFNLSIIRQLPPRFSRSNKEKKAREEKDSRIEDRQSGICLSSSLRLTIGSMVACLAQN